MPVTPGAPDVKVFKRVSAQLTDSSGHAITFFENGEVTPASINLQIVGGRYTATLPTLTDLAATEFKMDVNGRLLVTSGEVVDSPITTTTTFVVGAEAATAGSLSAVSNDGDATRLRASRQGVLFVSLTSSGGSAASDVGTDNSAAPATPNGPFILGKYESSLPTYANNDAAVLHTDANGRLLVSGNSSAATGTVTSVAASASNVTLLAANAARQAATFYNDSATANLYLKLAATASTSSFTVLLAPGAYYEIPNPVYTGIVDGIWDVASGNARITEIT